MKRIISVFIGLMMVLFCFAGCTASSATTKAGWDYIQNKGELIVGLDATFAPMGFTKDGKIVGFDIDLANAVGQKLGIKVKFQSIDWSTKELALSSKRIDCIWNGMSITPDRQQNMALTQPYLNNKIIIMGKDASKVKSIDDLKNVKIGVQEESSALDMLTANASYNEFKNNITQYKTYDDVILGMKAGRVDVMVVDQVLGQYKNAQLANADKLDVASFDFGSDLYAIGFRKGETDCVAKIESGIKACIADGTAAQISQKWFGKNLVLDLK